MSTNELTPAQIRLRDLRAQVAEQQQRVAEEADDNRPATLPEPGSIVHALRGGLTVHTGGMWGASGVVVAKGQNIVITSQMLQATRNKLGHYTGVALALDPDAQLMKYGEIRFAPGEAPESLQSWTHGDADWSAARENARRQAWQQPTDASRANALAEVERVYGAAATTSVTMNSAPDKSIAEAAVQAERLAGRAAGGAR